METTPAWRVHGLSCPPARHGHEAFPARGNPRRHVNHPCAAREDMCRQRRTAAKDATGPVTPGQEGNFFLGRSKALRYSAGTGRRAALSPAPHAERLGDIRKTRPSSHATTAFSVRNAWRFKPYGPALHGKKTQFFPLGLGWATLCHRLVFPFSKGKTLSPATTREFFACRSQNAPAPPSESGREASP